MWLPHRTPPRQDHLVPVPVPVPVPRRDLVPLQPVTEPFSPADNIASLRAKHRLTRRLSVALLQTRHPLHMEHLHPGTGEDSLLVQGHRGFRRGALSRRQEVARLHEGQARGRVQDGVRVYRQAQGAHRGDAFRWVGACSLRVFSLLLMFAEPAGRRQQGSEGRQIDAADTAH
jgi:hypothetical protein